MSIISSLRTRASRVLNLVFDRYKVGSYSQEGEDILLSRLFGPRPTGFYVDVGAHHPRRFSNTFLFYRRGWSGINIEPNPETVGLFRRQRSRDINLQTAIAEAASTLKYHYFDESALNTLDTDLVQQRLSDTPYKVVKTEDIPVQRLDSVLRSHLPPGQAIDFLTVDTEGWDLFVLRSNDWQEFRPHLVLAESLDTSVENVLQTEVARFMRDQDYTLIAKTLNTLVFRDTTVLDSRGL